LAGRILTAALATFPFLTRQVRVIITDPVMSRALEFFTLFEAVVFFVGVCVAVFVFIRGIAPALWRLGNGLAKRKIAIFAKGDNVSSLKSLLLDSKLLQSKNIIEITGSNDIGRAEGATLYLVFWHDWANEIDVILSHKPDKCALILYSPYDRDKIPPDQMKKLDGKRHTAVTNFRGRLLNDIVASMITTGYEKS
jgi:hypothetical protein